MANLLVAACRKIKPFEFLTDAGVSRRNRLKTLTRQNQLYTLTQYYLFSILHIGTLVHIFNMNTSFEQ